MGRIWRETWVLLGKDLVLEWRNRYAFNSILLYVVSTIFTCYLSFNVKLGQVSPIVWNAVFWIVLLFAAINGTAKGFTQERAGRTFLYWQIVKSESIILAKILFNILLLLLVSALAIVFYSIIMGNPVKDLPLFLLNLLMGAVGFASSLTLISAISAKSSNSSAMMPVLGFPVILPMILMLVRISKNALDGLAWSRSQDDLLTLFGLNLIVCALSYILFPYLWRN